LENTIPIGKKFGVILAIVNGHHFEIATFRSDAAYSDGRRPDAVYFSHPEEDARRRDFTINGMFYDPIENKVLDFVGGQDDIQGKTLRFIGDADSRIKEDNLRLLRAIRFKNALNFEYAPGTLDAIQQNAALIKNVSSERVGDELTRILVGSNRGRALKEMDETGMLTYLLPELVKMHGVRQPEIYHEEGDVFEHTVMALDALPDNPPAELAWAVLLHDSGKPDTFEEAPDRIRFNQHARIGGEITQTIGRRLKFSNAFTDKISWLVDNHMMALDILKMKRPRQSRWIHNPWFGELLELLRADMLGTKPADLSVYNELKSLFEQKELLLPMPRQLVTGDDIMREFNLRQGPEVGELLSLVHEAQMEEQISTRREALEIIKRKIDASK
jgi:poly(A) polymerase